MHEPDLQALIRRLHLALIDSEPAAWPELIRHHLLEAARLALPTQSDVSFTDEHTRALT